MPILPQCQSQLSGKEVALLSSTAIFVTMKKLALGFVALVAIEHLLILVMEMFLWTSLGAKLFKLEADFAQQTVVLAMNQGLYNGFLAAGLIWALLIKDDKWQNNVALFFLGCVAVAGIFGGLTAKWSIILTQGLPAILGFLFTYLARPKQIV